jgi:glucose-1-phosphate cytidylyltransferase
MKIVILCGGKGLRAFPFTEYLPKPMLPVGGSPIVVQVIKSFIAQGYSDFVLAAGYRKNVLDDYFEGKHLGGARIEILDTGQGADTGERVRACMDHVGDTFLVTYADGLCDISIRNLVDFHRSHDGFATITSVPMYSQYGVLDVAADGKVERLREKPLIREHWINAGFIIFDKAVFEHWEGTNMESHVFPHLVEKGLAYTYRHEGFFKSLDSYKDQVELEEMLASKTRLPWALKEAPDGLLAKS